MPCCASSSGSASAAPGSAPPAPRRTRPGSRPRGRPRPARGLDRRAELGDLAACVVDVELALDGVAGELRSRASASPNAAWRPLAAVSGPVGLADTNSTRIRSAPRRAPPPWRSPAARTSASAAACQPSERKRFRKPGPGDLDAVEPVAQQCAELGADLAGDVARRRADDRRQEHRRVRGVVAEARLLRALERRPALCGTASPPMVGGCGLEGLAERGERWHSVMVGLTRQDPVCAVELLEEHHAGELVGHRQRARATAGGRPPAAPGRRRRRSRSTRRSAASRRVWTQRLKAIVSIDSPPVGEQRHERALRDAPRDGVVLAHLDEVDRRVATQEAAVVVDVVGVRRSQPAD